MAADDDEEELDGLEGLDSIPPKSEVIGPSGKVYHGMSMCAFRIHDEPRRSAILFVEHPYFDQAILLTILVNVATMAWDSPLDPPGTKKAAFIGGCEWAYLAIFTTEMCCKILAYGFVLQDGAYLRDAWCKLDFMVVTLAWAPILFPSFGSYSVIRALRALRPLRALKRMPGMPLLVNSILAAVPKLADVVCLCGLVLIVLGIIGTGLFKGTLHYRCARQGYSYPTVPHSNTSQAETTIQTPAFQMVANDYDTGRFCDPLVASTCADPAAGPGEANSLCAYFPQNPNEGTTSFDSFGATSLVLLQSITFDEFAMPMYAVMDATRTPLVVVYWLLAVLFGGFFLVNLFLAVLFQVCDAGARALARSRTQSKRPLLSSGRANSKRPH